MADLFGGLVKGFEEIFNGVSDIAEGVVKEAETGPQGLLYFGMDAAVLVQFVLVFIYTNFICGLQMLTNLTSCIMYYLMDVFGKILYLPVMILFMVIDMLSKGLGTKIEKQIWDQLEWLDGKVYGSARFHIIHWPKSVRDKCYNCKRLRISAFGKIIAEFMNDVEDPIFDLLFSGLIQAAQGVMELFNGIMDLIGAIMSII